jgi:hypothetical protein
MCVCVCVCVRARARSGSMAYDDVEAEVYADFDIFRNQHVSHLAYKWQAREVEWLESAAVCRPFNSP